MTQVLNAVGALFLVMALSRGKAAVVAPVTNALAPVLTIVLSLAVYQTLPNVWGAIGIVLALVGSTLMVYSDEKSGEDTEAPGVRPAPPRRTPRPYPGPDPHGAAGRPGPLPSWPPPSGVRHTHEEEPSMSLVSTRDLVAEAAADRRAVAAFNVITLEYAEAITEGAAVAGVPVILQISENAVRFHGGRVEPIARAAAEVGPGRRHRRRAAPGPRHGHGAAAPGGGCGVLLGDVRRRGPAVRREPRRDARRERVGARRRTVARSRTRLRGRQARRAGERTRRRGAHRPGGGRALRGGHRCRRAGRNAAPFWTDPGHYRDLVRRATEAGFSCTSHAVADGAVRSALDAYKAAGPPRRGMHRVEHIETLLDDDLPRFAELGVAASMQPLHMDGVDRAEPSAWLDGLAPGRRERGWRSADIARTGAVLALGSDWMVADYDPRVGMGWARLRRKPGVAGRTPYLPEQALSPARTLAGYTTCPAAITGDGDRAGRLAPGRNADITVLGANPLEAPPDELPDVPVPLTVVDGAIVHRAP